MNLLPKDVLYLILDQLDYKHFMYILSANIKYNILLSVYWKIKYTTLYSQIPTNDVKDYILALIRERNKPDLKSIVTWGYDQWFKRKVTNPVELDFSSKEYYFLSAINNHNLPIIEYLIEYLKIEEIKEIKLYLHSQFLNINKELTNIIFEAHEFNYKLSKKSKYNGKEYWREKEEKLVEIGRYLVIKGLNFKNLTPLTKSKLYIKCGGNGKCNNKVKPGSKCRFHFDNY